MTACEKEKLQKLQTVIGDCAAQDICVAFSGGVDSALLLKLACDAAARTKKTVWAVTFDTVLHPAADMAVAKQVASEMGANHAVLFVDELSDPQMKFNPVDRCYLCKKSLFERLLVFAEEKKAEMILEGSNADDLKTYRPGLRAVRELGIKSPLAECALTKDEVRLFSRELGISVANRPSTPCLATRLPYGAELDAALLGRIGEGERRLREMGFANVRVRVHKDTLRLEVDISQMQKLLEYRGKVLEVLSAVGCRYLTLDLEGFRSGSMDTFL